MKPLAIIGLDPGTTSAYAVLDLHGNLLASNSGKELTSAKIIHEIFELCQPLITATDKAKLPSLVGEISRKLGTEIVIPAQDLKHEEKRNLLASGGKKESIENQHQADALAAATFAYRKYLPKLEKIEHFIQQQKLEHLREEFTKTALKTDLHFFLIKEHLTTLPQPEKIFREVVLENKITKKNFLSLYQKQSELREKIGKVEREKEELRLQLQKAKQLPKKKNIPLNQQIETIIHFKEERLKLQQQEIATLQKTLSSLHQKIELLYHFISLTPIYTLMKKVATLSKKEVTEKNKIIKLEYGDALLVLNPDIYSEQVVQQLQEKNIILFTFKTASKILRQRLRSAVISKDDIKSEQEYFALIAKELIEKKINQPDFIERLVQEYQQKRKMQ